MAPVEENAPAASAEMETVSKVAVLPVEARSWPLRSMSRASDAPDSSRKLPSTCPMREASFSWITRSRSIALDLLFLSELAEEHHAGHRVEGVEHARAEAGHALERRHPPRAPVERVLEVRHRGGIGEIALVVLDHARHAVEVVVVLPVVLLQVAEALHVLLEPLELRVGDEHHAV